MQRRAWEQFTKKKPEFRQDGAESDENMSSTALKCSAARRIACVCVWKRSAIKRRGIYTRGRESKANNLSLNIVQRKAHTHMRIPSRGKYPPYIGSYSRNTSFGNLLPGTEEKKKQGRESILSL